MRSMASGMSTTFAPVAAAKIDGMLQGLVKQKKESFVDDVPLKRLDR